MTNCGAVRRLRRLAVALVLGCCMWLSGCATPPQTAELRAAPPPATNRARLLEHVPFFAQDAEQCGPAALAMVLRSTGIDTTPHALRDEVFLPARGGSLQAEMLATARRHGRLAVVIPPRITAILAEIEAGNAVIVLLNLALPIYPIWHYAVVVGHDFERDALILNSGVKEHERPRLDVFEHTWARSGYWAMAATEPDRLPVTPGSDALAAAAAALERSDATAARRAFTAITQRDPNAYVAWMGLGNSAFAAADFDPAAIAFARATEIRPSAADAWNNLALTRHALGHYTEGRAAAERAVEIGGIRLERYLETLRRFDH